MPIFEYHCRQCNFTFEKYTSGQGDGAGPECPRCGRKGSEKVFSVFASQCGSSPSGSSSGACGSGGFS